MPVMENTWYLPDEALKFRNYPEVNSVMPNVQDILNYAMRLGNAIDDYNNGVFDRVDVDIVALQNYITQTRAICETLGNAPNVCFDLLLALREIQDIMQTLLYAKNRYGNQYVGAPSDNSNDTDSDTI